MKTVFHKADTRGHANHGWLDSHHTFSFAGYYEPERINFGLLRVLNDDLVTGGRGFGQHPHDNMEIVSIPLAGALEHGDSAGGRGIIRAGEVQIMSAGSGIEHSEKNASPSEAVNFLQVWVFPKERDIKPRYEQKVFPVADRKNKLQTVISPGKGNGALWINQDAWFTLTHLEKGASIDYSTHKAGQGVYAFVIEGSVTVGEQRLSKRDGLGISETDQITIAGESEAEVLLIEVPMN